MTTYGYARVSTNGQDLGSEEAELAAARSDKIFREKVSGARRELSWASSSSGWKQATC